MNSCHRTHAQVNLKNIQYNVEKIKKSLPDGTKIMPVIKADAYGHGAVETAKSLNSVSDAYGVALIEEAIELRQNGITKPILIVSTISDACFETAIENDITIAIYTLEMATKLSETAKSLGKKAKAHLVVDTGMNRIGMKCDDASLNVAKEISSLPSLDISGIFSHFATSDETDKTFSKLQYKRFVDFCDKLKALGINPEVRHICNSAAVLDLPLFSLDMVRPGIVIYGLAPSDEVSVPFELRPALELKSHITHIKSVEKGEGISYGLTHIANAPRTIATVCAGYADGVPRLLSNAGRVIVKGKYAPIVGRVCMDQFMIDVTDIKDVCVDDIVTIIGTDGDCFISCEEVAKTAMTINYEIVCGINKRVPRVYIK